MQRQSLVFFFFQAEDGIRDYKVTGVQTCALPISYRVDKAGIIHCTIGKATFEVSALKENLHALIADLHKAKPAHSKGQYLKRITLSSTMGPGVMVDQATLS